MPNFGMPPSSIDFTKSAAVSPGTRGLGLDRQTKLEDMSKLQHALLLYLSVRHNIKPAI